MASLTKVMPERKVLNWCILGNSISAKEAFTHGLITHLTDEKDFNNTVNLLIKEIKLNSPAAIKVGLEAYENISNENNNHEYLHSMLNKIIKSKQAKEGLQAFNQKRNPNWHQ
jgi:enoyl-CoA hydratase/carnithine racemase